MPPTSITVAVEVPADLLEATLKQLRRFLHKSPLAGNLRLTLEVTDGGMTKSRANHILKGIQPQLNFMSVEVKSRRRRKPSA